MSQPPLDPQTDPKSGVPYSELLGELFDLPEGGLKIVTWTPAQHGKPVPGSQVHIILYIKEGLQYVVRLKSRAAVNRLIKALVDHRDTCRWQ